MTTPTQAQIEAAIKAMQELWIYPTHDWQFKPMAEAALTAAAQVGGPPDDSMEGAIKRGQQQAIAEEAAQVGEAPTDKMMIEHLNDQIQILLCENEQLKAAAQVGEQECNAQRCQERNAAYEGDIKQLENELAATIEHCAQRMDQLAYVEECADDTMRGVTNAAPYRKAAAELRKLKDEP